MTTAKTMMQHAAPADRREAGGTQTDGGGAARVVVRHKSTKTDAEGCSERIHLRHIMKICGACERELPDDSYSEEQRGRRQSIRRCEECVDAGKQLVLMRKGRTMSERDECLICNLPLPLDSDQTSFHPCWLHEDVVQGLQSGSHEARHDGLSILSDAHTTKREPEPRHDPKASRRGRSSGNMWSWE